MMPIFLSMYWRQIGFAAIVLVAFIYGFTYKTMYQHEKQAYEAYRGQQTALAAIQAEKNALELKKREEITTNVAKGYSDAVSKINHYYNSHPRLVRLQPVTDDSCAMPTTGESAKGTDTPTGRTEQATTIDLEAAGREVEQCRALIDWELKQQSVIQ